MTTFSQILLMMTCALAAASIASEPVCIRIVPFMPIGAVCSGPESISSYAGMPSTFNAPSHVFSMGDWFKVGRINTITNIADVIQFKPNRYGLAPMFKGNSVGWARGVVRAKEAIAKMILGCGPIPASISFYRELREKPWQLSVSHCEEIIS